MVLETGNDVLGARSTRRQRRLRPDACMCSGLTGYLSRAEFTRRGANRRRRYRNIKTAGGSQLVAQVSQLNSHILDSVVTVLRIFCQAAPHDSLQMTWRVGAEVADRSHRLRSEFVK